VKSIEEFLLQHPRRDSRGAVRTSPNGKSHSSLPPEVRQIANRGLAVFPAPEFARLNGREDFLIGEATSQIARLEELALEYPLCTWRVAIGQSRICVLRMDGPDGRASLAGSSENQPDCSTLISERGQTTWAFFWRPKGIRRDSATRLPPGITIFADSGSCPIPPSHGCAWRDLAADIEAMPSWLRELTFESPENPPAKALSVSPSSAGPAPCRSRMQFESPRSVSRKASAICNQVGFRGYRACRRR
jgi:hypothetical protein